MRRLCLLPIAAVIIGALLPAISLRAKEKLELQVVDKATGRQIPARLHLMDQNRKPKRVPGLPYWHDHVVFDGALTLELPRGTYLFELEHGPECRQVKGHFIIQRDSDDVKTIEIERVVDMAEEGWWSADLHIHRDVKDIELLMRAEDLHIAPVITWWSSRPNAWKGKIVPEQKLVQFDGDRFYHIMAGEDERAGGALLYFNLNEPLPVTDLQKEHPSPMQFVMQAKAHENAWIDIEKPFWWDVPTWLASGQMDSIGLANNHMHRGGMYKGEAWGKPRNLVKFPEPIGNGRWSEAIYYHALNCGLRIPPSAGGASGVLPNPVGYNRVYAYVGKKLTWDGFWEAFRAGAVVVTNGPLLRPFVQDHPPGHIFTGVAGEELELEVSLDLATRDPISYLEIVQDGKIVQSVRLTDWAKENGRLPKIKFKQSGWFLVRAVTDVTHTYRFASSGPFYVQMSDAPRISKASAQFFLAWVNERIGQLQKAPATQREEVLRWHLQARKFWEEKVAAANAD